ncbi:hypothetical protein [Rhodopila sp.]|uniref:hypothetical protein n=1 Tax=Rhodopila sp. TaxID=2480087 RepID=UPI002D7E7766|nr:hypothetical protein [Rhodopila sp.]
MAHAAPPPSTETPAASETPAAICKRLKTDDRQRPIPESLVPAVNAAFGTRLPAHIAVGTTVYRCADGHVLVCTAGANIPCGKANTSRTPGPGPRDWCRNNPNADFIPAVATGHDTIYAWACKDGHPRIIRQMEQVDRRGFMSRYWKIVR